MCRVNRCGEFIEQRALQLFAGSPPSQEIVATVDRLNRPSYPTLDEMGIITLVLFGEATR